MENTVEVSAALPLSYALENSLQNRDCSVNMIVSAATRNTVMTIAPFVIIAFAGHPRFKAAISPSVAETISVF